MGTRRRPKVIAEKPAEETGRRSALPLVAVLVSAVVIMAAIYYFASEASHDSYIQDGTSTAPDFSLVDTEGNAFSLVQNRGSVIILDFMGTTCEPCKTQIDNLKPIHASYATSGVRIISIDVNAGDSSAYLQNYKIEQGATWSFAVDTAGASVDYSVTLIPTIVIIDPSGNIVKRSEGVMSSGDIAAVIEPFLGV